MIRLNNIESTTEFGWFSWFFSEDPHDWPYRAHPDPGDRSVRPTGESVFGGPDPPQAGGGSVYIFSAPTKLELPPILRKRSTSEQYTLPHRAIFSPPGSTVRPVARTVKDRNTRTHIVGDVPTGTCSRNRAGPWE